MDTKEALTRKMEKNNDDFIGTESDTFQEWSTL